MTITGLDLDRHYYTEGSNSRLMEPGLSGTGRWAIAGKDEYHILLAHSRLIIFRNYAALGRGSCILSGHYHGGTVRLPLSRRSDCSRTSVHSPVTAVAKYTKNGKTMIVSGGLGTHSGEFPAGKHVRRSRWSHCGRQRSRGLQSRMNKRNEEKSCQPVLSVKLEAFEGPLDLLLHLIDKNKVNIYDIPIAEITGSVYGVCTRPWTRRI